MNQSRMVSGGSNSINDPEGTSRDYMGNLQVARTAEERRKEERDRIEFLSAVGMDPNPNPDADAEADADADFGLDEKEPGNVAKSVNIRFVNVPQSSLRFVNENDALYNPVITEKNDGSSLRSVALSNVKHDTNLLRLADSVGLKIPSGCRTGLCGSCTAAVYVPGWEPTMEAEKSDWQLIRCCSAGATAIVNGEMTIDLRGVEAREAVGGLATTTEIGMAESNNDPLARFSQNWENEYVPDYLNDKGENARSAKIVDPSVGIRGRYIAPWDYVSEGVENGSYLGDEADGNLKEEKRKKMAIVDDVADEGEEELSRMRKEENPVSFETDKWACNNLAPWDKIW